MHPDRIAELLQPFLGPIQESDGATVLQPAQLDSISIYIDVLLRWNARVNLTSVRKPEEIVTRHFGESIFAARYLFPAAQHRAPETSPLGAHVIDVGTGAGFPGLPIMIWAPQIRLTLIESNHKKVAFLREVVRALTLTNVDVFAGRAEDFPRRQSPREQGPANHLREGADVATLRAVEHFDLVLPAAAILLRPAGKLGILIGHTQIEQARHSVPSVKWEAPVKLPLSSNRFLIIGSEEST